MTEQKPPTAYYYSSGDQRLGPVTGQQLKDLARNGQITPTDTIWRDESEKGMPAGRIKGLFPSESLPSGMNAPTATPAHPRRSPNPPPSRRLFLSCVSHEFRSYRDVLATRLAQPGVELRRQEDFVNSGHTTLQKLNDYIRTCDAVIHLVGHGTGAYPEPPEVESLLAQLHDFTTKLGLQSMLPSPGLSYTQWEAWLAIYHGKPLALYRAADVAQRESGFMRDDAQREHQQLHWKRLESRGRDRKEFVSANDLCIEVLRAMPMLVPGFTENVQRGQSRDRNLIFALFALQDEMLTREAFVRVCQQWNEDTSQHIADVMHNAGLLTPEDRALVEARVERKLKTRGGDVRQSLADCLGSDERNSLGDALDPESYASLPDQLSSLTGVRNDSGTWRYRLTRTHGVGGLGVVSMAEDSSLERNVAVKQLRPERLIDPMAVERFIREARITGRLQHPNIVPVYELGLTPDDQVPFYAMRFVGHRTLHDAIIQHHSDKSVNPTERNLRFRGLIQSFLAVCNAVAYAHEQKVIHRDIKPANVMIGDFGEVILLDWGLAKRMGEPEPSQDLQTIGKPEEAKEASQTRTGARLGSPAYMSPEQVAGRIADHSALTDVYGLGATLYEVLTGDVPFSGTTTEELFSSIQHREAAPPRSRNPSIAAALSAICLKAMSKAQSDRYPAARALAEDIQHWLADEPAEAYPEPLPARLQRVARKHPGPVSAIAATVLVGVFGLTASLILVNSERGKAVAAQQEAEKNFELARETVNNFAMAISRDDLSVVPGVQDLRVDIARKAMQQNESLASTRPSDPTSLADLGESRINYAQVLLSVGSVDTAVTEAANGLAELEKAHNIDSSDEMKFRMAKGLSDLGGIYWDTDQYDPATPHLDHAIDMLESLHLKAPENTHITYKLAQSLNIRGNCAREVEKRIADYERSRNLASSILATHPRVAEANQVFAAATFNLAMRYWRKDERQRKLDLLRQAQEADARILAMTPNAPRAVSNSSLGMVETGALLAAMGNYDESKKTFELAEASARRVLEQNPKVTRFSWLLADTLKRKAEFHSQTSDFQRALDYYNEASSILEKLVDRVDDRPQYAVSWVEIRSAIASFSQGLPESGGKRDDDAWLRDLNAAVEAAEHCLQRFPRSVALHYQLGKVLYERHFFYSEKGQWDEVRRDTTRACSEFEAHVIQQTRSMDDDKVVAYIGWLQQVQTLASETKDRSLAEEVAKKAMRLSDRVSDPEAVQALGATIGGWGKVCKEDGNVQEAIEAYETELKVCNGPFTRAPWHFYLRSNVAGAHLKLAQLYETAGDVEKEVKHRQAWLRLFGAYFQGMKTETFLDPDPAPSLGEAKRLREHMKKEVGMRRFTIPCDFSGRKFPFHVYISDCPWPKDPLEDQVRWLEEVRGGTMSEDVRVSFREVHKIAYENNLSLQNVVSVLFRANTSNTAGRSLFLDIPSAADLRYAVAALVECSELHNLSTFSLMRYCSSLEKQADIRMRADTVVSEVQAVERWLTQQNAAVTFQKDKQDDLERLLLIAAENGVSFKDLAIYALGEGAKASKQ